MVASLAAAGLAFRAGLGLRRARLSRRPPPRDLRRRHLALAKLALPLLLAGFVGGPLSSALLRDWTPFGTFHGIAGALAALLFVAAALQGRRLEGGRVSARQAHGLLGALAMLIAAVTAVAGFVLLP